MTGWGSDEVGEGEEEKGRGRRRRGEESLRDGLAAGLGLRHRGGTAMLGSGGRVGTGEAMDITSVDMGMARGRWEGTSVS